MKKLQSLNAVQVSNEEMAKVKGGAQGNGGGAATQISNLTQHTDVCGQTGDQVYCITTDDGQQHSGCFLLDGIEAEGPAGSLPPIVL